MQREVNNKNININLASPIKHEAINASEKKKDVNNAWGLLAAQIMLQNILSKDVIQNQQTCNIMSDISVKLAKKQQDFMKLQAGVLKEEITEKLQTNATNWQTAGNWFAGIGAGLFVLSLVCSALFPPLAPIFAGLALLCSIGSSICKVEQGKYITKLAKKQEKIAGLTEKAGKIEVGTNTCNQAWKNTGMQLVSAMKQKEGTAALSFDVIKSMGQSLSNIFKKVS